MELELRAVLARQQRRQLIVRQLNRSSIRGDGPRGRAGVQLIDPGLPLNCWIERQGNHQLWSFQPDLNELDARSCSLQLLQSSGNWLSIKRHYGEDGGLLALPSSAVTGAIDQA